MTSDDLYVLDQSSFTNKIYFFQSELLQMKKRHRSKAVREAAERDVELYVRL